VGWREICSVERVYAHAAISLWQWDRHCDAAFGDGDDYSCRRTDTGQDRNSDDLSLSYSGQYCDSSTNRYSDADADSDEYGYSDEYAYSSTSLSFSDSCTDGYSTSDTY
jgi:hypothetical protein